MVLSLHPPPPAGHEWPYYVLDAVPITFSIGIFNVVYPPEYLPNDRKETLDNPHEPLPKLSEELPEELPESEHGQFKLVTQGPVEDRASQAV